jgi:hypothetical protein
MIVSGETGVEAIERLPIGERRSPVGAGPLHCHDQTVNGATRSGNLVFDSRKQHGLRKVADPAYQHVAPHRLGERMVQKRVSDP